MPKNSSIFVCQTCGAQTPQFFGKCSSCGDWNSIIEQLETGPLRQRRVTKEIFTSKSESINSNNDKEIERLPSGYKEFDRVLGGGLVPGSIVLIGGDPGIGKSTLLLQSATAMSVNKKVLYVSAEESSQQVRLRWKRLKGTESNLQLLAETDLDLVMKEIEALKPEVTIIDSIQALHDSQLTSSPGSVSQVRECSAALQRLSKQQNIALLLVGHVTKEGMLAGPKVLEHLVDAVLTFEGDRFASHRLLRTVKNRYGATHELGVFEMQGEGLIEINNPSELFISGEIATGVATIVACEGTRSLAIDLQALISSTTYASPRRTATGIETNRLHQILAVIEKHMNINLSRYDCYLAVAGGLQVEEPAADLGIAAAIISSYKDIKIPSGTIFIGEIGLGGQLRPVSYLPQRLKEAIRLGFKRAIVPERSGLNLQIDKISMKIIEASNINEAITFALK